MKQNTITIKEVFERVVKLEALMTVIEQRNRKTVKNFTVFSWTIVVLELINMYIHYFFR